MTLDQWRNAQKLSFGDLARLLACSRAQAHRLCRGTRLPDRGAMARIHAATDGAVTPNDFYAVSEPVAVALQEQVPANG